MTEREVPALLHQLAVENGKLAGEVGRLRMALRAITEVRYTMVGRSNSDIAMAYVSAFSRCQGIAQRALDGTGEECCAVPFADTFAPRS